MQTLLLDQVTWDLVLDANGNIALAGDPYSIAQDVASAIRLFKGEYWFDTTQGVPYWEEVLGKGPSIPLIKKLMIEAALTVPGVVAARVFISGYKNRVITGQVQVTTSSGIIQAVGF